MRVSRMPKVNWASIHERTRCTHSPLCIEWTTADTRKMRICRMSDQHLANTIDYCGKAIRYYNWLANSAFAYAERKYYLMAADAAERAGDEAMDIMAKWMWWKEVFETEQKRRNGVDVNVFDHMNPFGPEDCPTCGAEGWVCDHD